MSEELLPDDDKELDEEIVEAPTKTHPKSSFLKEALALGKDLVIIILIVLFIRTFIMLPFQIKGPSMLDSFYDKEFIIVDRFTYLNIPFLKEGVPQRGDVIVFRPHISADREYFIKRIIGLPGDRLKIEKGNVYLFDKNVQKYVELDEGYLSKSNKGQTYVSGVDDVHIYDVPSGEYFAMGDNRLASTDSRSCFSSCMIEGRSNYVKFDYIVGRVWLDLGYFNIRKFNFIHPELGIDTTPKFLSSPKNYHYNLP